MTSKESFINNPEYKIYFQTLNIDLHKEDSLDQEIFDHRLIREDEVGKINFTKRGVIKLSEQLLNITTDFNKFFDKNNLILHCKKTGSIVCPDFIMGKCEYKLEKSLLPHSAEIQKIVDLIYNPDLRMKWDTATKNIIIKEKGDSSYVTHIQLHSPVFFISERETLDKRIEFFHNNIYYSFSTSVSDDYLPLDPAVVRCTTYVNLFMVTEDEKYFYLMSINQVDPKMNLPDNFVNMMLPFKISSFYKNLVDFYNKYYNN